MAQQMRGRLGHHDQADAIGILTYGLMFDKITPPWIAGEVLLQPLEVTA